MTDENILNNNLKPCECGCKEQISVKDRYGVYRRYKHGHNRPFPRGEQHQNWKGGRCIERGYVLVKKYDHPNADKGGYVFEHRLIMEKQLGRYLTIDEIVHHINEKTTDNRVENLQVMTRSEHRILHGSVDMSKRVCEICGSRETSQDKKGHKIWNRYEKTKWMCKKCSDKRYRKNHSSASMLLSSSTSKSRHRQL